METDVAVIGAGPCGCLSALVASKNGARVTVFEEHPTIGAPSHCAGHFSVGGLKRLGLTLPPKLIENTFNAAIFVSPNGKRLSVRFPSPVTCTVNRELFDQHLAKLASKAGAEYASNSKVVALAREQGSVKGLIIQRQNGSERISASVVIDAEGVASRILKNLGLKAFDSSMLVKAVSAEVDQVEDVQTDCVEVYLGNSIADGFYAWVIPKKNGTAKIGLATCHGNPKQCLGHFMHSHEPSKTRFRNSRVRRISYHSIPVGGPIPKTYAGGFLAVGDVASQVKPTTGGGVVMGLTCSRFAGEVAGRAVKEGDFSANFLGQYESLWRKEIEFDMNAMLFARKLLNRLSDHEIDRLFSLAAKLRLEKSLIRVKNLDFQGMEAARLTTRPSVLFMLVCFFFSALT